VGTISSDLVSICAPFPETVSGAIAVEHTGIRTGIDCSQVKVFENVSYHPTR
jgi:hypothetical protein